MTAPRMPKPGTDAALMLDALMATYPEPAWNLNSALGLTAHSRASDLRRLGWDIEAVSRRNPAGSRKARSYGYQLNTNPDTAQVAA